MDFKAQYLRSMHERAPQMFKNLSASGELEKHASEQAMAAEKLLRDMIAAAIRENNGSLPEHLQKEAERLVRALMIEFPPPSQSAAA